MDAVSYLEFHRCVFFVLGSCVAFVVKMIGSGGMDNG